MQKAIKVDEHLHVPLQFYSCLVPYPTFNLSSCFFHVRCKKLTQYSMREKLFSLRIVHLTKTKEFYEHCNQLFEIL